MARIINCAKLEEIESVLLIFGAGNYLDNLKICCLFQGTS